MADIQIVNKAIVQVVIQPTPVEDYLNQSLDNLGLDISTRNYTLEGHKNGCVVDHNNEFETATLTSIINIHHTEGMAIVTYKRLFNPPKGILTGNRYSFLANNLPENLQAAMDQGQISEAITLSKNLKYDSKLKLTFREGKPSKGSFESFDGANEEFRKLLGDNSDPDYKQGIDAFLGLIPLVQKQKH